MSVDPENTRFQNVAQGGLRAADVSMFSGFRTTELEWQEGARQIDDCDYLFIESLSEVAELTLGLVVVEAKAQKGAYVPVDDNPLERIKAGGKPIQPDSTCRVFEVLFDRSQMSYTVLNECYGVYPKEPEKFVGKLFR